MLNTVILPDEESRSEENFALDFNVEEEILRLKKDLNAVILAHYYQEDDIQDIADFVGDSLDLSRKAAATKADVIVFSGVKFMAETAKILSPGKTVIFPDEKAGCSLEDSCPPDKFKAWRAQYPDHISLTYINSSAEVKALTDIVVTSSNAEYIVNQIPQDKGILFAPDKYLGGYLAKKTGRNMVLWPGTCIVHEQFSAKEITKLMVQHPEAAFIAHPECPPDVLDMAEHVGSTSSLLKYVTDSPIKKFIVGTEQGIFHQMRKANPDKEFIAAPGADGNCNCANCPFMKLNTLEKIYLCMVNKAPRIEMDANLMDRARHSLEKMLAMSPPPAK